MASVARAIVLRQHGDPETLRPERVEIGAPAAGEVQVRQTAIGVNFHDVYVRSGLYRTLALPGIPGIEAVGTVESVGLGVHGFAVGDRVGYVSAQYGAYAGRRNLPATLALKLPDGMDDRLAATVLLKGLTAEMLLRRVAQVGQGTTILVHAAAGGVGRLLCQWAAHLGATVIGTVGSDAKSRIAREAGCHHTILYRSTDFVEAVKRITGGRGVDIAFDSVGKDTFYGSLDALAPLGHLVNFGQSSGPVEPLQVSRLATKSNSVTRPILFHYLEDPARLREMAAAVFGAFARGFLSAKPGHALPLAEVARAHQALEARSAEGPFILIPGEGDA
jgi:NADPH2:quinone reductase